MGRGRDHASISRPVLLRFMLYCCAAAAHWLQVRQDFIDSAAPATFTGDVRKHYETAKVRVGGG